MLINFLVSVIIATILATLSGLGVGGGTILMLWLTMVKHFDVMTARLINLMYFIPAAAIASALHFRKSDCKISKLFPAMLSGCICAVLFSLLVQSFSLSLLGKAFGIVLILTGLRELTYRPRNAK